MANNYIQNGNVITVVNATGSDVVSGEAFVAGATVVVAAIDIANGASGTAHVTGVFNLPKVAAAGDIAAGAQVNLAATGITDAAGAAAGICAATSPDADTEIEVSLNCNNGDGT